MASREIFQFVATDLGSNTKRTLDEVRILVWLQEGQNGRQSARANSKILSVKRPDFAVLPVRA